MESNPLTHNEATGPDKLEASGSDDASSTLVCGKSVNWTDQDEELRNLWMLGESKEEIAKKLGRSPPAVMTRAARLGLSRRFAPGRKPLTADEKEERRRVGVPVAASARRQPIAAREGAATLLRVCLMCLTRFESTGPHNRICPLCKNSAAYSAASRLPDMDFPSATE
ncbi:MAG: hypothetical protein IPI58_06745 [Alphaproteobacteria bacterium]|nr:MAG: hypothetical protein IPI58_06745 [Alphaproteobacteria bacterium]